LASSATVILSLRRKVAHLAPDRLLEPAVALVDQAVRILEFLHGLRKVGASRVSWAQTRPCAPLSPARFEPVFALAFHRVSASRRSALSPIGRPSNSAIASTTQPHIYSAEALSVSR